MRTNWGLPIKLVGMLKRACWSWESLEFQFLENYYASFNDIANCNQSPF